MNSLSESFMKRRLKYNETPNIWVEANSKPVSFKTNGGIGKRIASREAPAITRENRWKRANFIKSY